ncbi:type I secretion system permease/ATPase [Pseudooceanicola sp. C21-150M6]|uniref:type I secretion system permease/ATPase n=1 Tax=Pseudooceanicola sp. C21-150M6 TaxID=3434355 RepID=UPI003D7FC1B4
MSREHIRGKQELREERRKLRGLFWAVGLFSFFGNLLLMTGPLYMLQVYDRVLGSRSIETLVAISVIAAFLFLIMGLLDAIRARVMSRAAARFQANLDARVFDAVVRRSSTRQDQIAATGIRDLESIQRFMSSPALFAFYDIPWTPLFLLAITLFHPLLGLMALCGGIILLVITFVNQMTTQAPLNETMQSQITAEKLADGIRNESEMVASMGMREAAFRRWKKLRDTAITNQVTSTDLTGMFSTTTRTFRLFLQSAMLGLGAFLVLDNLMSAGAMIAGSILLGRALQPIEILIGQWPMVQRASKGWQNLIVLLGETPPQRARTALPVPRAKLSVIQASVVPPGESVPALRALSFELEPGHALGVIGKSGAGKSTLARAITGVWSTAGGKIRLDGAALDQYDPSTLGRYIGYLPQRVQLFDGTIAENIARLADPPDDAAVVAAARKADAHDMILKLPDGYNTRVSAIGGRLSGGQIQRLGLARALYGDPVLLVLDEPNSNLDNEGSMAINQVIRNMKAQGKSAIVIAHRPNAIQECDLLLMLEAGTRVAFGPRDDVLKNVVQNHRQVIAGGAGGLR